MDAIYTERGAHTRLNGLAQGIDNRFTRLWQDSVVGADQIAQLLDEPLDLSNYQPVQGTDGTIYFMVGIDALGDPNRPLTPGS